MTAAPTFKRGDTVTHNLERLAVGEVATASCKLIVSGKETPKSNVPVAQDYVVEDIADAGGGVAGWRFSIQPAQTINMRPGTYAFDEKVVKDGVVIHTDTGYFELEDSITP